MPDFDDDEESRGKGGYRSPVPGGFGWTDHGEYGHEPWNRGEGPGWMSRPGREPSGTHATEEAPSDGHIRDEVRGALAHEGTLDASRIEVTVADGVVVLSGSVPSSEMWRAAEDAACRCPGVRDVDNRLRVV